MRSAHPHTVIVCRRSGGGGQSESSLTTLCQALLERLLVNILPQHVAQDLLLRANLPPLLTTAEISSDDAADAPREAPASDLNLLPPCSLPAGLSPPSELLCCEAHPCVTVCFADVVGFTATCLQVSAEDLVSTLNQLFSAFDRLCVKHRVEKIKTIGISLALVFL